MLKMTMLVAGTLAMLGLSAPAAAISCRGRAEAAAGTHDAGAAVVLRHDRPSRRTGRAAHCWRKAVTNPWRWMWC